MKEYQISSMMYRLSNLISRQISQQAAEEDIDISYTNTRIIRFLATAEAEDIYQKDVEKEFSITRSTASRVLMLMEQKGLITRHSVKHDARLKKLMLTEKALWLNEIFNQQSQLLDQAMLVGFSEEEKQQLSGYFERIIENVANGTRN